MLYKPEYDETAYDTEESFLNSLTGGFKGNDKTVTGTAFHRIIEEGEKAYTVETHRGQTETAPDTVRASVNIEGKTVVFNRQQLDTALAYKRQLRGALHEIPAKKVFPTRYGDITVYGTTDVLHGTYLRDIKTRFSACKQQDYIDSYQWRIYLSLFDAVGFMYDIFEFRSYKPEMGTDVTGCPVVAHEPVMCLPYASMESDLTTLFNEFIEYVRFRGLEEYISAPAAKYGTV
jgi:hypothetical protein